MVALHLFFKCAAKPRGSKRSDSGVSAAGSWSITDDRLYAHEAAGLLVGGEDLAPEQQLTCLSALMQPLLSQIEQYLPAVKGGQPASNGVNPGKGEKLPVNMVLQVPPLCHPEFLQIFFIRLLPWTEGSCGVDPLGEVEQYLSEVKGSQAQVVMPGGGRSSCW